MTSPTYRCVCCGHCANSALCLPGLGYFCAPCWLDGWFDGLPDEDYEEDDYP